MSGAAAQKSRAGWARQEAGRKNLISYNINKKHEVVKDQIIRMRQRLNLEIEDWRRFAIFTARVFLDFAPAEIRARFTGRPSETPREAADLAETFLLLYTLAEDKAKAADAQYSLEELWQAAIKLAGVAV
jgi:hypothetical protein